MFAPRLLEGVVIGIAPNLDNSVYTSSLTNWLKFLKVIMSVSLLLLPTPSRNSVAESGENPGEGHVQS